MQQRRFICLGLLLCSLLAGIARADSFQLTDGSTLTGDIVSVNENGMRVRQPDGNYSDVVSWGKFSQDDLKKLAKDPKMQPLVTPFIEITEEQRIQKTEVPVTQPHRLKHPAATGLFGAMLSSTVGLFVIVLLYGAGIYAAYEVSVFRRRPPGLVCGIAAIPVIGFLSPIIFLALPTQAAEEWEEEAYEPEPTAPPPPSFPAGTPPSAPVPASPATASIPSARPPSAPARPASASAPAEPEPAPDETSAMRVSQAPAAPQKPQLPPPQIFQRGAFMFNRRFFETKFPGFMGVTRREADKDMVLIIKSARGEYVADRIARISANDFHIQVRKGPATEEVMIPFTEVQEVRLKHKDSP